MSDRELFELRNGRVVLDEEASDKLYKIKNFHPETRDEESTGFEWSDMGMAELFGELYNREARYCVEHKSWYLRYRNWAKSEGLYVMSTTKFYAEIERHLDWTDGRIMLHGYPVFKGFGLKQIL